MQKLRSYLHLLPDGDLQCVKELTPILMDCWDDLEFDSNDDGGMMACKLQERSGTSRVGSVEWHKPVLSFEIERHGGAKLGSTRAEIQVWTINLENGRALYTRAPGKQLRPRSKRLDVKPLASDIAKLIKRGKDDPRLKWFGENTVGVKIEPIIPRVGPKNTWQDRRGRFWEELDAQLSGKWKRTKTKYVRCDLKI